MEKKIQNQLNYIQEHINRNFKRWFKIYPNLEGVHVGKKESNGKVLNNTYSIVFHVTKKRKKPAKKVPTYINIPIGNKKKMRIPSDVIETGKFTLHGIKIGDETKNDGSGFSGTISFYFTGSDGVYLGSNMHVLAPGLIDNGQTHYDVRKGDSPESISFFNNIITSTAQLIVAQFDGIDFALAKIDDPEDPEIIERVIKSVGAVNGFLSLDQSNFQSVNTSFYGISSKLQRCSIKEIGALKHINPQDIFLTNLLKFDLCTEDGDSGAAVFDQQHNLVGIIIGRDTKASYALHIDDVINFFQQSNL